MVDNLSSDLTLSNSEEEEAVREVLIVEQKAIRFCSLAVGVRGLSLCIFGDI